jgi:hypothetical protein
MFHWQERRHNMEKWERRLMMYDTTWLIIAVVWNFIAIIIAKCAGNRLPISTFIFFLSFAILSIALRMAFIRSVLGAIAKASRMLFDSLMVVAIFCYIFAVYLFAELSEEVIKKDVGEIKWFDTMSNSIFSMFLLAFNENGEIPEYLWANNRGERLVLYVFTFTVSLILMEFLSANILDMMQEHMEQRQKRHGRSFQRHREEIAHWFEDNYGAENLDSVPLFQMYVIAYIAVHYIIMIVDDSFEPGESYKVMWRSSNVLASFFASLFFIIINVIEVGVRFAKGSLAGFPLQYTVVVLIVAIIVEVTDIWHPTHLPKSTAVLTLRIFDLMLHLTPVRSVAYAIFRVSNFLCEAIICTFFIVYYFAVMGYLFWGSTKDEGLEKWFSTPQSSLFAMWLMLCMELGEIPTDLHTYSPYTCFFYVPYITVVSLVFTNVMVGVLVAGIAQERDHLSEHQEIRRTCSPTLGARKNWILDSARSASSHGNSADVECRATSSHLNSLGSLEMEELPQINDQQPPSEDATSNSRSAV